MGNIYYKKNGNVCFVEDDLKEILPTKIIRIDLLSDAIFSKDKNDLINRSLIRHDSYKIGEQLLNIFNN